jgi:protein-tyrosine phosphatase
MLIDKDHPAGKLANFRHLGGISTPYGVIRDNFSYRSDDVSTIDDEEAKRLASLEISMIIDFRDLNETKSGRGPIASFVPEYLNLPLIESSGDSGQVLHKIFDDSFSAQDLGDWYFYLMGEVAPLVNQGLQAIAESNKPVVFHCAAGKDRTGIFTASLLSALDTEIEHILDDFEQTQTNMPKVLSRLMRLQPMFSEEAIMRAGALLRADREAMSRFLELAENQHGGLKNMLVDSGLQQSTIEGLKQSLIQNR